MKILVIGAGLIGAATAFRLARAGAEVMVMEATAPAAGASGRSFGWINASFYLTPAHHHLRAAAMVAHHRLQGQFPDAGTVWPGCLSWEAGIDATFAKLRDFGYPAERLTRAQIAAREPNLITPPEEALFFPGEGAVDAAHLTKALLKASGAKVLSGIPAKYLLEKEGRIIGAAAPIGPMLADHTILAAAVATPGLLQKVGLDLPMLTRPGLILRTAPVAWRLSHILATPLQEIRQDADGSLLTPCAAHHQADASETLPDVAQASAATLDHLAELFGQRLTAAETRSAMRPVPGDGLPVLGRAAEGLSVAVMHSGITLAALAAEALEADILGQGADPLWAAFRPDRLLIRQG